MKYIRKYDTNFDWEEFYTKMMDKLFPNGFDFEEFEKRKKNEKK